MALLIAVVASVAAISPITGFVVYHRLQNRKKSKHMAEWHALIRHHDELDAHLDMVWDMYSRD